MKPKIRVELPPLEPDPPDGVCALCAGVVHGFWVEPECTAQICTQCRLVGRRWGPFPRFPHISPETFHGRPSDIGRHLVRIEITLYHLEKEIERQKPAGPAGHPVAVHA